jgi:hypothetical protein
VSVSSRKPPEKILLPRGPVPTESVRKKKKNAVSPLEKARLREETEAAKLATETEAEHDKVVSNVGSESDTEDAEEEEEVNIVKLEVKRAEDTPMTLT